MNDQDYLEARTIIMKCLKSKTDKQPFDFKRWEFLDYEAKKQAFFDMTCPLCHRVGLLTGTYQHLYGTEKVCEDCSDENNPRLMKFREEFNNL